MTIQFRSLAIALAISVPIALMTKAESSAAPSNGTSIKAAVPAVTIDVRYHVRRGRPYPWYRGYPTPESYLEYRTQDAYWGYPTYNSYRDYPTYNSYSSYPTYHRPGFSYGWW